MSALFGGQKSQDLECVLCAPGIVQFSGKQLIWRGFAIKSAVLIIPLILLIMQDINMTFKSI